MTQPIIKVENISKQYRLGTVGTGSFAHDMNRWWHRVRGKDDPYLKIGEVNDRTQSGGSDYVWALQDINFEVQPGEILGIIGKNGAGKSTLLKLLSRVTAPTTGKITCHGRIASLLEVGTGFHPELTGKENIYLNGAILGMTKKEIASKYDEIVDFAGCAKYINTPVKRYSSGMYVRLAFAVAAHLEPDILVVDEVLAVGDAEFQKKAIGKMQEVSQGQGRTVLFVSHNMASVKSLCKKGIILENGKIKFIGETNDAIEYYLKEDLEAFKTGEVIDRGGNKNIEILSYKTFRAGIESKSFFTGDTIVLNIQVKFNEFINGADLGVNFKNSNRELITHITNLDEHFPVNGKKGDIKNYSIQLIDVNFSPDTYFVDIGIVKNDTLFDVKENCFEVDIQKGPNIGRPGIFPRHAKVYTGSKWTLY